MEVSDARKQLFMQKSRSRENIPPTQAALKQDIKQTVGIRLQCPTLSFQACQIGVGGRTLQDDNHCGLPFEKNNSRAMNSFTVSVQRESLGDTRVSKGRGGN